MLMTILHLLVAKDVDRLYNKVSEASGLLFQWFTENHMQASACHVRV